MGPKIESLRPQVLRAPERRELPTSAAPAPQQKPLTVPRQPADGFAPQAPTAGGRTPTGGIVPQQKAAPASLAIDPERLSGFKKLSDNLVGFAVEGSLKNREAKKAFESAFILAGATEKEAKFLRREAMQTFKAAKAAGSYGGLTVEKYGYKSLPAAAQAYVGQQVDEKLPLIKTLKPDQIQALALETAQKAPEVKPDQIELARDFFLFSAGKRLSEEGFDFGAIAKPPSPLDANQVDTGEWRRKLQFLP